MGLLFSTLWAAYCVPPFIYWLENETNTMLPYEMHMRLYIGSIILLLLLAYGSYALYRRINLHIFIGCLLSLAYVLLLIIFVFDSNHSLDEEFSWIRYPTSKGLLCGMPCSAI